MRKTLVVAALFIIAAGTGLAQTSSNVTVSANVTANCTIATTTNLDFLNYDPVGANATLPLDGTGELSVNCTKGASGITVSLGLGANVTGTTRRMAGPAAGEFLTYELYTTAAHSTVWNETDLVSLTGFTSKDTPVTATIYGRIAPAQDVQVGAYNDTVVATVHF